MFSDGKRAAIFELQKQGHGSRRIARALRASRTTIRYIINSGTAQVPKILRHNKAEPYRAQILELYSRCRGNLVRVHKELMAQGAQFSYAALTSFVRRNDLWDAQSDVTRSITAAQQWLTEIIHGSRSLELLKTEIDDSSELTTLLYSVKNGRLRERKKAATILARKRGIPNTITAIILHSSRVTTRRYFKLYSEAGPSVLFGPSTQHSTTQPEDTEKTRHILEFLHQKPTSFGINRTSWTQRALIQAYKECYNETISRRTLTRLIKNAGYGWRKARRVLTSPDPNYRDKVALLLKTLNSLTASELLFFLDEWGPVQVWKRGGKAYSDKDNIQRIPRHQTSRGTVALVAALSATTNQMTWTFVPSKDTLSMIGLLEILFNQYHAHSKLYVTWDAVSWHNSTTLTDWLDRFNETTRRQSTGPIIELVPLPTSAQFLNVIEGVLSGMTRAVVNNSDYNTPDDMKLAISRHFNDRNKHFRDNPRRAGKKLWEIDFFHGFRCFQGWRLPGMVDTRDTRDTFLIDGTGLFEASHKAFLGIPLLVIDGEDFTFLFGVIRNLLELRQTIGIEKGLFVVGGEAHKLTSIANVENTVSFLKQFGIAVVYDPRARVLDLCVGLAPLATYLVTHDRGLLLLASDGRRIILLRPGDEPEVFSSKTVISRFGVTPDLMPAFLALTDGPRPTVLTKREAIAVLAGRGDLAAKIADPSTLSSRQLGNKLTTNGAVILNRLKQFSPSAYCSCLDVDRQTLEIDIDNDRNVKFLSTYAFYSLRRLLPRPARVSIVTEQAKRSPENYHAIVTLEDLQRLVTGLGMSKCCAVDTESSDKDPHTAHLFGVSISVKKGEAFYIPTVAHDLKDTDRGAVVLVLKRLLEGPIKVVGHNLKYDYVLLRRHGIKIANIDFDTMLAAYDCFGDSDVLNLQYLAKRLLGRTIKSHSDIVSTKQSLLDLPFRDVADYACEHAEVTLQLGEVLQQELVKRGIDHQYRSETLPMVKTLGDWEVDGIPVDLVGLCRIRDSLADQVSRAKEAVFDEVGRRFNLDSEKEVSAVLRMDQILAKVVGFRKISSVVLEELGIAHKVARLVVRYKRCQKKLRDIEGVIESVHNSRVHPVFSQTRTDHGRLSSVKPRLFNVDNAQHLSSCLPDGLHQFCPDVGRALGILADLAADNVLQGDLLAAKGSCCLQKVPPLNEGDHLQLLLSVVVGVSDHQLCRIYLLDPNAIAAMRHDFKIRYSSSFLWLEQFCNETAARGFASARGRRRYFDGLRSSNLEKRDQAMHSAVKWLIRC